jgi:hypothetical protein
MQKQINKTQEQTHSVIMRVTALVQRSSATCSPVMLQTAMNTKRFSVK